MNKDFQKKKLQMILQDKALKSGIYLIDTDMDDDEIEKSISKLCYCHYIKEKLYYTSQRNVFESLIVDLSYNCRTEDISKYRENYSAAVAFNSTSSSALFLILLNETIKLLCLWDKLVIHVQGNNDLASLNLQDLFSLETALNRQIKTIIVISKLRRNYTQQVKDSHIDVISLKETADSIHMENRFWKVHISYKHDAEYDDAIKAIVIGLQKNNINYSIDDHDIPYRGSIDDYEKEIGASYRVIMFVTRKYLESLDCMFEMEEMFKKEGVINRIFPLVNIIEIPRNSDGLSMVKKYWQGEKERRADSIRKDPGKSDFLISEIQKIEKIIDTLDEFWNFICRYSTGNYDKLIDNDAQFLIEEIKKTLPIYTPEIEENFVPSDETKPVVNRVLNQNGVNIINIENNSGPISFT
jgi:hypothetical protein